MIETSKLPSFTTSFDSITNAICLKNEKVNNFAITLLKIAADLTVTALAVATIGVIPTIIAGGLSLAIVILLKKNSNPAKKHLEQVVPFHKMKINKIEFSRLTINELKKDLCNLPSKELLDTLIKTYHDVQQFEESKDSIDQIKIAIEALSNKIQLMKDLTPSENLEKGALAWNDCKDDARQILTLFEDIATEIKKTTKIEF